MKLLDQLHKSAKQFTYEFYLQQFPAENEEWEWQKDTFNSFTENGQCLSENMISEDIGSINKFSKKVSDYTDRAIAHWTREAMRHLYHMVIWQTL